MAAVMIGVDPAKRSHAMAVLDEREHQLAALQVGNDSAGYRDMVRLARRWPERTWAVEGAAGVGVQLAQRLVADGESVLGCAAQAVDPGSDLRRRARPEERPGRCPHGGGSRDPHHRSAAGGARRRDGRTAADERASPGPGSVPDPDGEPPAPAADGAHRLWGETESDRQEGQGSARDGPAPRDVAGRTRRQLAADLFEDLVGLDRKLKELDKRLKAAVACDRDNRDRHQRRGNRDRGDDPRRGRGGAPIPVPAPLRHLHRGRPDRGVLRRGATPPAVPGREPPAQPRPAHHRAVQQALRRTRRQLLREEARRRQRQEGCPALPETTPVRQRLPAPGRGSTGAGTAEPGWAPGATLQSSAAGSHPNTDTSEQPHTGLHQEATPGLPAAP